MQVNFLVKVMSRVFWWCLFPQYFPQAGNQSKQEVPSAGVNSGQISQVLWSDGASWKSWKVAADGAWIFHRVPLRQHPRRSGSQAGEACDRLLMGLCPWWVHPWGVHTQQGYTIICNSSILPRPAWFNLELGKSGALLLRLCADLDPVVSSALPVSLVLTGVGLGVWEDAFQLISFNIFCPVCEQHLDPFFATCWCCEICATGFRSSLLTV